MVFSAAKISQVLCSSGDGVGDNDDDDVDDVEKSQQGLTEVRRPERNTGPQKDRC